MVFSFIQHSEELSATETIYTILFFTYMRYIGVIVVKVTSAVRTLVSNMVFYYMTDKLTTKEVEDYRCEIDNSGI